MPTIWLVTSVVGTGPITVTLPSVPWGAIFQVVGAGLGGAAVGLVGWAGQRRLQRQAAADRNEKDSDSAEPVR